MPRVHDLAEKSDATDADLVSALLHHVVSRAAQDPSSVTPGHVAAVIEAAAAYKAAGGGGANELKQFAADLAAAAAKANGP